MDTYSSVAKNCGWNGMSTSTWNMILEFPLQSVLLERHQIYQVDVHRKSNISTVYPDHVTLKCPNVAFELVNTSVLLNPWRWCRRVLGPEFNKRQSTWTIYSVHSLELSCSSSSNKATVAMVSCIQWLNNCLCKIKMIAFL